MSSVLHDLYETLMLQFYEIENEYYEGEPMSPNDKHFHTLLKQYLTLATESLRKECESLKEQFDAAFKLYEEAKEIFADCPASSSDEIRDSLYANIKRLGKICGRLQGEWIKSQHHYEDEYERIQTTLPKCPRCEDNEEERIEKMREEYYREMEEEHFAATGCMGRNNRCECSDCEEHWDRYG
jgi:ribosomal protein L16 Arg81 hydroxylase